MNDKDLMNKYLFEQEFNGQKGLIEFLKDVMNYKHTVSSGGFLIHVYKNNDTKFTAQITNGEVSLSMNSVRFYSDSYKLSQSTQEDKVDEYREMFLKFYESYKLNKELPINKTKRKVEKI